MRNRAKKTTSLQTIICKGHILLHCFQVCQSITLGINVLYSWTQNNPWHGPNSIKSQENAVLSSTRSKEMHRYTREDPHTGNDSVILIIVKIQFVSCPSENRLLFVLSSMLLFRLAFREIGHPNRWIDDEMHVLWWLSLNTIWLLSNLIVYHFLPSLRCCTFFNVEVSIQRKSMRSNFKT